MYKFGFYLVMASLVMAACDRSGDTADLHDHTAEPDGPATVQSTLFTDQYEFFIEYGAMIAGEPSDFLVHVTDLETYDPVRSGSLTIRLGDAQVTADAPVRPGIFEARLVPAVSGSSGIIYTLQGAGGTTRVHAQTSIVSRGAHDHTGHQSETAHNHEGESVHDHLAEAAHDHAGEKIHDHKAEAADDHAGETVHDHEAEAAHDHASESVQSSEGEETHDHIADGMHDHAGATSEDTVGHQHAPGSPSEGDIVFLKEQAWKSDFMVREVLPAPFSAVVKASGQILAVPGEKKHLAAHTSGMLVFRNKLLVQGARVEKGQPLFVIVAASLSADNFEVRYRELRNQLEQSRSEFRRHKSLYAEQVISERQYIASKTNYINDSIRFYDLASKASGGGLQIIAPISGYIHELNFSEGQYVETGDQLVTISSNEKLLLRADVPMQHYPMVDQVVTANFRTGYSERIYTVDALNGTLLSRGSSVAENDHFIPVYFEVTNDGTLLEGAFVEFFLKTREQEQAIAVPAGAISEEQGVHYCYLQVTGESYTKQAVTVGENDGKLFRITSGLKQGDRLVTEGVMLLKAASLVVGDAGHGHAH